MTTHSVHGCHRFSILPLSLSLWYARTHTRSFSLSLSTSLDIFVLMIINGTDLTEERRLVRESSKNWALKTSTRRPEGKKCISFHHSYLFFFSLPLCWAVSSDRLRRNAQRWKKKKKKNWVSCCPRTKTMSERFLPPLCSFWGTVGNGKLFFSAAGSAWEILE